MTSDVPRGPDDAGWSDVADVADLLSLFGERTVRIPLYTPPSPRSEPGDPRTMGPWDAQVLGPRDPARGRRFRGPSEVLRSPRAEPATTPRPPVPRPTTRLPFDRRPPMVPHRAPGVHPVPRLDTGTRAGARNIGPRVRNTHHEPSIEPGVPSPGFIGGRQHTMNRAGSS
jgi:hypothetical protein